jgi:hypothetical protein
MPGCYNPMVALQVNQPLRACRHLQQQQIQLVLHARTHQNVHSCLVLITQTSCCVQGATGCLQQRTRASVPPLAHVAAVTTPT